MDIQNQYFEQVIKRIIQELNPAIYSVFHSSYIFSYFYSFVGVWFLLFSNFKWCTVSFRYERKTYC